jgi:hypothetical protein
MTATARLTQPPARAKYAAILSRRRQFGEDSGFDPTWMPDSLFGFQSALVEWATRKGRAAIFADCGLGKSAMQLTWAENVVRKTNRPVLILTPLAVAAQMVQEAAKFGIHAERCGDGRFTSGARIIVTNYERLHHFTAAEFAGVACDESGILKNHAGATRNAVCEFMRAMPYRLLCTATPAPNDVIELGNSVEALGICRRVDMLAKYFIHDSADTGHWRLKGHAIDAFWSFAASWARAIRHPRDIGFEQDGYDLPPLQLTTRLLPSSAPEGFLFPIEARTLDEQRHERRTTIEARCAAVAELVQADPSPFLAWCSLNDESAMLGRMIPGAVELSGSDSDDVKEEKVLAFATGQIRALVTKPKICSHGVNWQSCHRMSFFPSHSHEQFYQAVRRCWRFMQRHPVIVHIVTTEAESSVLENLRRKEREAGQMFSRLVDHMRSHYSDQPDTYNPTQPLILPSWL